MLLDLVVRREADHMPVCQDEIEMALFGHLGHRLQTELDCHVGLSCSLLGLIEEALVGFGGDHAIAALGELYGVAADPTRDLQDIERRIQADELLDHVHIFGASIGVGKTDFCRNHFPAPALPPRPRYHRSLHRHNLIP